MFVESSYLTGQNPDDDDALREEDLPWFWSRSPYEIFQYAMKRMVMEDNWKRVRFICHQSADMIREHPHVNQHI